MNSALITGEKVYLRQLDRSDLNETYLGWLNDSEVTRYLESRSSPYTKSKLKNYYDQHHGAQDIRFLAIVEINSGLHIGNVKLEPINWTHQTAVFGILIGEKSKWGKGYGTEATKLAVEYAFEHLNLRKVSLGVVTTNIAAVKTYEKLGFVTEGTKRQEVIICDKLEDVFWMGLLRNEYQATNTETRKAP
tara:strand:+ start:92 stop:661 length:570 start_codon:yes stop_codon:yes gene_type:complete